ncbi:MAG: hypothetical protein M1837_000520 [Sclerophora amabilis]|nr:MAG: hypothetical protein M1837_000520 [Sclerophora amabilis]
MGEDGFAIPESSKASLAPDANFGTHQVNIELEEPSRASIAREANAKFPLILPWHPSETITPGTLFHSSLCLTDDPWAKGSPWVPSSLDAVPVVFVNDDGGQASFKSATSTFEGSATEHLSVGVGTTLDCKFLKASVSGRYDRDVAENRDSSKSSIRSTFRIGAVRLSDIPRLTDEALITIKYGGGIRAFEQRYGDYFVAGYRLGGDTGVLVGSSGTSSFLTQEITLEAKVKALCYSKSWSTSKAWHESLASNSFSVMGYDTLGNVHLSERVSGGPEAEKVGADAKMLMDKAQNLGLRVEDKLAEFGLPEDEPLEYAVYDRLTRAGLVAELLLLPVATLKQVMEWSTNDNII